MQYRALAIVILLLFSGCKASSTDAPAPKRQVSTARNLEVGCATCIFHMKDVKGCKLAVKIEDTPYLVTGSDIDDHGDAHAGDGLCNSARMAVVEGQVNGNRFAASKVELVPQDPKKPATP